MYDTLYRLYTEGKLSEQGLLNAVARGWIKAKQAQTITKSKKN